MKELEDRQAELERLIIIERSKMQVKVSEKEIRAYYESALLQEPRMLINFLIREIIVCGFFAATDIRQVFQTKKRINKE